MGGPIWSDPIHQQEWAASILSNIRAMSGVFQAYAKISAILTSISEVLFCFFFSFVYADVDCSLYARENVT
jgi:tRNA G26 N,N-dimethylase Trm1